MRQIETIEDGFPVRTLAVHYGARHRIPSHTHAWGQLVYAASGVMTVTTANMAWLVPPMRAVWIPPRAPHEITVRESLAMRTLYIAADAAQSLTDCRAIEVAPLLRELILHIVGRRMLNAALPRDMRLMGTLLDLIADSETAELKLPLPRDPRARRLAHRVIENPESTMPLAGLAKETGGSLRTLQRRFSEELGLSIEAWRSRARLQHGVVLLSGGLPVTEVALQIGYAGPSAFISAFKLYFGVTPARYRQG